MAGTIYGLGLSQRVTISTMSETPAEIIAKQIGYANDDQKAFALAAANMYIEALKEAGYEIVQKPKE